MALVLIGACSLAPVSCRKGHSSGWAEVAALEWGVEGYEDVARSLAAEPIDWIIAAGAIFTR